MPMKMKPIVPVLAVLALLVLGWPRPSHALNLCLLNCTCSVSATALPFNSYNPLSGSPTTSIGTVTASCKLTVSTGGLAQLVSYTLSLSAGQSGSFSSRSLARSGGGGALGYNIYTDSGMTTIWGDGTGGSQQQSGSLTVLVLGASVSNMFSAYGKIPAGQTVAGGSYGDTIVVTMSF